MPGVLVDSIRDVTLGEKLTVNYDVCGLSASSPYNAHLSISKRARMLGKMKPVLFQYVEVATGSRMRKRKVLDVSTLGEGNYTLKVAVSDVKGQLRELTRDFQIVKPPPGQ